MSRILLCTVAAIGLMPRQAVSQGPAVGLSTRVGRCGAIPSAVVVCARACQGRQFCYPRVA